MHQKCLNWKLQDMKIVEGGCPVFFVTVIITIPHVCFKHFLFVLFQCQSLIPVSRVFKGILCFAGTLVCVQLILSYCSLIHLSVTHRCRCTHPMLESPAKSQPLVPSSVERHPEIHISHLSFGKQRLRSSPCCLFFITKLEKAIVYLLCQILLEMNMVLWSDTPGMPNP